MTQKLKLLVTLALFSLIPTLLLWLPFFLRIESLWKIPIPDSGMATIVSNYDGPLYMVVAKTLYNKELISQNYQFPLPAEYYPAHFPLFPILIKAFSLVTNLPYAMLGVSLVSSFLAIYFFHKLIADFATKNNALFLTFLFSVFPARWLIVRSVGSADPLFVAAIIASLYYFRKKQFLAAGIWGAAAQLTKSAGILLFASYFLYLIVPDLKIKLAISKENFMHGFNLKKTFPIFLIPLALLAVFALYYLTTGDFLAYFHSGDNIHLGFPPFQIFNFSASWVGTSWLEEIIFVYLLGAMGIHKLIEKKEFVLATFAGVFYFFLLFVSHRDLLRYALPIVPLMFVAYEETLSKKNFRTILAILIVPIYLLGVSFLSQNAMPISNWAPFL